MKKRIGLVTLAILLLSVTPLWGQRVISVGWEDWEPYQLMDSEGNYTGVDLDLAAAIIEGAGYQVEYIEEPWNRLMNSIENGSVDVALGASKTPERETYAYFSDAYRQETFVLLVRKGESDQYDLSSLSDIPRSGFTLGTVRGYYYGEEFDALSEDDAFRRQIDEATSDMVNITKLVNGRIDGIIIDPVIEVLRDPAFMDRVEIHPMEVYSNDSFMMFSKETTTPEIISAINESLQGLRESGEYQRIMSRYLSQ